MAEAKSGAPLSLLLPGLTQPSPRWDPSGLSKPVLDWGCAHRVCAPVQPHQWLTSWFALRRFSLKHWRTKTARQKVRPHLQQPGLGDGDARRVTATGTVQPLRCPTRGRVQLTDIRLTFPRGTPAGTGALSLCGYTRGFLLQKEKHNYSAR